MVLLEVKPKDMLIQMLEKQSVSSVESSCPVLWWRWFYSIWNRWYSLVLFHRSCFEYSQVVGVLKWLIITGEWSMGWCQKRPFQWYLLWKGYWFSFDGDGISICYSLMSGWLICCGCEMKGYSWTVCIAYEFSTGWMCLFQLNRIEPTQVIPIHESWKRETVFSIDHGWYQWWNETVIICISRRSYPTRFIHSRVVIGWSVIIIRIEHSLLDL